MDLNSLARTLAQRAEEQIFKTCIDDTGDQFWIDVVKTHVILEAVIREAIDKTPEEAESLCDRGVLDAGLYGDGFDDGVQSVKEAIRSQGWR